MVADANALAVLHKIKFTKNINEGMGLNILLTHENVEFDGFFDGFSVSK
jgi:hypothetical protein